MDTDYMNAIYKDHGLLVIINDSRNFEDVEKLDYYRNLRHFYIHKKTEKLGYHKLIEVKRFTGQTEDEIPKYCIRFFHYNFLPKLENSYYKDQPWHYNQLDDNWERNTNEYTRSPVKVGEGWLTGIQKVLNFLNSENFYQFVDQCEKIGSETEYLVFKSELETCLAIEDA